MFLHKVEIAKEHALVCPKKPAATASSESIPIARFAIR